MVMIALRAYHRQIEEWIDQGLYDQAIAHCRHILNFYPKSIDTYRLLGKAFLENQRYGDATDILQRVLSSIPDDFVSHVGMSIVREDEGNINEAIWHMERAFEIQPSNNAVQGELRRLYGRRDGIEPPKINLNRGALARMYIKGNLHTQAIADLRVALAEEPQRPDLQVLLAKAYLETQQLNEAAEVAAQILAKLPYCYEANRILREVLMANNREKEAQVCFSKMAELDPYAAHLTETIPSPDLVVETAVMVEKFDQSTATQGISVPQQPEWASTLGLTMNNDEISPPVPDWMNEETPSRTPDHEETSMKPEESSPSSEIPDWMREAGWQESTSEESQEAVLYPLDEGEEESLEPVELPDWLKELSEEEQPEFVSQAFQPAPETAPWLAETPSSESDSVATWLNQLEKPDETVKEQEPFSEEIPEWLQDLNQKSHLEADFQTTAEPTAAELPSFESETPETPSQEELPPWLVTAREETPVSPADELPDWLKEDYSDTQQELPDWLVSETSSEPVQPIIPEPPLSEEDTKPVFIHAKDELEPQKQEILPPEEIPSSKEDEAFAWLESLAAKQGAEEALLLSPEERREQPPEWIREYLDTQPASPALEENIEEQVISEAEPLLPEAEAELPEWLQGSTPLVEEKTEVELPEWFKEEVTEEKPAEEEIPDWLMEPTQEIEQIPESELPEWLKESSQVPEPIAETELPSWLKSEEETVVESEEGSPSIVEETPVSEELPSWLKSEEEISVVSEEALPSIVDETPVSEEVPDWLKEFHPPQLEHVTEEELPALQEISTSLDEEVSTTIEEISAISPPEPQIASAEEIIPSPPVDFEVQTVTPTGEFETARALLQRGDLSSAFNEYQQLIRKHTALDEIISDLNDALYRYPMDVKMWMLLGDAYLRKDMLSEAMNAYNKAEELLR